MKPIHIPTVIALCCTILSLSAKSNYEIVGQVIDAGTRQPLPDAYIIYQNKSRGTIVDMEGRFRLSGSQTGTENDTIYITHLGYRTRAIPWMQAKDIQIIEMTPSVYELPAVEIQVSQRNENWNKIFVRAVREYANLKRKDLFIALGHYSEEAHYQDIPIMYMESLGYILYTGDLSDAAPYSNMNFFCDQTRSYVTNQAWVKYRKNMPAVDPADVVLPGSGSNLNFLRVQQEKGLLSPRKAKKYKCNLDSSYMLNQYPVYVLRIKRKNEVGTVQIMEVDGHYLIRRFHVNSQDYWSTAWHDRMPAEVSVKFQYIGNTPFVKKIMAVQRKGGLEYRNELVSLIQKLDTFSVTSDEYWNMNTYSNNPYITFDQDVYNRYVPDGIRKQYEMKRKIFGRAGIDLDEEVNAYSDRWFLPEPGEEEAIGFMKELRNRVF